MENDLIINPETGKPVSRKDAEEKIRAVNIILIDNIEKERQIANLCYNMIQIGNGGVMPAYVEQLAHSVWKTNIKKWSWEEVRTGSYR